MENKEIYLKLMRLFRANDAVIAFRTNMSKEVGHKSIGDYVTAFFKKGGSVNYLIANAFNWHMSDQGFDFWLQIHKKWEEILAHNYNNFKSIW